jgi:hypothetical protein
MILMIYKKHHFPLTLFFLFETRSGYEAKSGLELAILLPQPHECWHALMVCTTLTFYFEIFLKLIECLE